MRTVPATLQTHLDTGATTLCWCWLITRRDGVKIGFTNHDRDLTFGGDTYQASTGFLASEMESSIGLSVDNTNVQGAVSSDEIAETDIYAGLYDDAVIDIYLVNWSDVTQRLLLKSGNLGEVTRGQVVFEAEVRGLSAKLQQKKGRVFGYTCDVDLGSTKCGIDLNSAVYKGTATVVSETGRSTLVVSGLGSYSDEWFTRGKLTFTSGSNSGLSFEVKSHKITSSNVVINLWSPAPFTVTAGDTATVTAGCDKTFKTCKAKFSNPDNFRGFPHMPGNDFVISYANKDDVTLDGGGNFVGAD